VVGPAELPLLFESQDAWRITRNTLGYNAVFIILGLVISVAFALMLFEITSRSALKIYQTIFFFPYFLSWVVVGYVLYAFLSMEYGLATGSSRPWGDAHPVVHPAGYWPPILVFMNLWKTVGYFSVIYYAGLMGIDKELFEACVIDGANKWRP